MLLCEHFPDCILPPSPFFLVHLQFRLHYSVKYIHISEVVVYHIILYLRKTFEIGVCQNLK